ncbi:MAG TPA: DUF192 domain-containing protein [Conexibacter sp.]|nr:DUF192 domain-containing protein [Conexibacter sp.]
MELPRRLRRLPPVANAPAGSDVRLAAGPLARLLGLAGLRALPSGAGLLLPGTRSIHTCGMRFALDLLWLDRRGRVVRVDRGVRPWRVRGCRGARAVLELPARARATDAPAGP